MADRSLDAVIRHIRKMASGPHNDPHNDRELLERFVECQDRAAFTALMHRHGPMVWGVCWRLLRQQSDTEDAFQATFLVLLRNARSIRKRQSLGSWLYGVAFRTALKARKGTAQRRALEKQAASTPIPEPWREAAWRERTSILDDEVQGLSERYRAPLVLCYLEGRTRDEAAQQLGWSLRTLQRRLDRAREILRLRLTRRGLTLSAGLLATALSEQTASAAAPAGLIHLTGQALLASASKAAIAGPTSWPAAVLAESVLRTMFISKLMTLATIFVIVSVTVTGTGWWTYRTLAAGPADTKDKNAAAQAVPAEQRDSKDKKAVEPRIEHGEESPAVVRVPSPRDGIVRIIGTEIKAGEKMPPERTVNVKIGGEVKKYRRLKKGDVVEEGQLLAQFDDDLARGDVTIQTAKLASAEADKVAAEKTRDEAKSRYETQVRLFHNNVAGIRATTKEDLNGALLVYNKYVYETISKEEAIKVARQELSQARKILEMHEIRSPSRGVIKAIYKRPGEAVKALETVFLIQVPED